MSDADQIKLDSLQRDPDLEAFVWQVLDYARTHHLTGQKMRDIFTVGILYHVDVPLRALRKSSANVRKMKDSA